MDSVLETGRYSFNKFVNYVPFFLVSEVSH